MTTPSIRTLLLCSVVLYGPAQAVAFPVVAKTTQLARDTDRCFILQTELRAEWDALHSAHKALTGAPSAEQRTALRRHAENIKALRREIGNAGCGPAVAPERHAPLRVAAHRATPPVPLERSPPPAPSAPPPFWDVYGRAAHEPVHKRSTP